MVTPRKKTTGFSSNTEDTFEEELETNPTIEAPVEETPPEPEPYVEQFLSPSEDSGPRFIEKAEEPVVEMTAPVVVVSLTPEKRHPRNVPRFSRIKKG
jgi:hypothetical protein